ncbi:transglutaminase-like cysteine peptidase [Phreatobacter sp. AB_2022a]|uniref:transglutaminase-like cysteine peptidase n=1 Tax=Phreatobacter sp. AB_2022a TaxID=3003134 RepID=UPI0022875D20|nr:transglutaminase-like cysteine peptidase [Phreatobacter sp. AB_2022a]MCZ0736508.1 transglutaminase-like cysteine peptidase [Phreatobacter sp. AB_2022a]
MPGRWTTVLGGCALALAIIAVPGGAGSRAAGQPPAALTEAGETSVPIGWTQFCAHFPEDCRSRPARIETLALTRAAWGQLTSINAHVNAAIEPVTDMEQYGQEEVWTYPLSGRGDCEDYVLLKKQMLVRAGLPASALLITVVRDRKGEGHAILTVRTDRGDYVLDNETDDIRLWHETGYRFVKRQSREDPNRWVTIGPASAPAAVASQ